MLTTAVLRGGILSVVGTSSDDQIVIQSSRLLPGGRGRPETINVAGVTKVRAAAVRLIVVDAGDGNDTVVLNLRPGLPRVRVDGGPGDDFIRGRAGPETLIGGLGNDTIVGNGGNDVINAGPGEDWVNGQLVITPPPTPPSPITVPPPSDPQTPSNPTSPGWVLINPDPVPTIDINAWVDVIYRLVNEIRAQAGLSVLTINPKLVAIAQLQANQMVKYEKMQHNIPEAPYPTMQSRADAVGYALQWLGENLAFNHREPEAVVQGWMLSTGHREILHFAAFTEMGVAIALDSLGRAYVALELGKPK